MFNSLKLQTAYCVLNCWCSYVFFQPTNLFWMCRCWKPLVLHNKSVIELTSSGWRCHEWRPPERMHFPSKALSLTLVSFLVFTVVVSLGLYIRHKQRYHSQVHFTQLINENYLSSEIWNFPIVLQADCLIGEIRLRYQAACRLYLESVQSFTSNLLTVNTTLFYCALYLYSYEIKWFKDILSFSFFLCSLDVNMDLLFR